MNKFSLIGKMVFAKSIFSCQFFSSQKAKITKKKSFVGKKLTKK
jgi:hypothetical protein